MTTAPFFLPYITGSPIHHHNSPIMLKPELNPTTTSSTITTLPLQQHLTFTNSCNQNPCLPLLCPSSQNQHHHSKPQLPVTISITTMPIQLNLQDQFPLTNQPRHHPSSPTQPSPQIPHDLITYLSCPVHHRQFINLKRQSPNHHYSLTTTRASPALHLQSQITKKRNTN
jgi:hypothetical protein